VPEIISKGQSGTSDQKKKMAIGIGGEPRESVFTMRRFNGAILKNSQSLQSAVHIRRRCASADFAASPLTRRCFISVEMHETESMGDPIGDSAASHARAIWPPSFSRTCKSEGIWPAGGAIADRTASRDSRRKRHWKGRDRDGGSQAARLRLRHTREAGMEIELQDLAGVGWKSKQTGRGNDPCPKRREPKPFVNTESTLAIVNRAMQQWMTALSWMKLSLPLGLPNQTGP
jgi:hypothetical protein